MMLIYMLNRNSLPKPQLLGKMFLDDGKFHNIDFNLHLNTDKL